MTISFEPQGSLHLLRPMDEEARAWIEENVTTEGWQWFGGALAVEPRYSDDLLRGFLSDGGEVV